MKRQLACIFLFSIVLFAFSQEDVYQKARFSFENNNYEEALANFQLASEHFLKQNDIETYLKSQLYLANIETYKNNFSLALRTIDTSIKAYQSLEIKNDSIWGELMNTKALIHKLDGNGQDALKISNVILSTQLQNPTIEEHNLIKTYSTRGDILISLSKYDDAIVILKKALAFPNEAIPALEKATIFNTMGSAYLYKEDFDKAGDYYKEALQLKLDNNAGLHDLALTTFNIGIISEVQGYYNDAIEFYKKSARYDLQNQGEEVGFISDIYVALSNAYTHKKDLAKAEEYINMALEKGVKTFGEDHINVANVYASYARILKGKGEEKMSLVFNRKALAIRERSYGLYNRFSIENLKSIASSQVTLGNYDAAKKQYDEVLRRTQKMNSKVQEAYCYSDYGKMNMNQEKYKEAIGFFRKALLIFSENFYKNHRHVLETELLLVQSYVDTKSYDEALKIIKRHLNLHQEEIHDYPFLMIEAMHWDGVIALTKYKKSKDIDYLKNVFKNLDLLIESVRKVKKEYTTQNAQIDASNIYADYFEAAIETCYLLYENKKDQHYLEKAFQLSEMNRNSTLIAGIKDKRFKKMANIPDSLLRLENMLKQKLSRVKRRLYRKKQSHGNDLMDLRMQYGNQLDSLLFRLESDYPKYYQLKYSNTTASISDLKLDFLSKNTSLIEYYIGRKNTYVFVVNHDQIGFKKLPITDLVKTQVEIFRKGVIRQQNVKGPCRVLFDVLLKEFDLKKNIIIVTDGVLNYLPFETLIHNDEYLLKNKSISYVGSATLLQAQKEIAIEVKKPMRWGGFAPDYEDWNSISSNYKEIESIATLMSGTTFLGSKASLKNFKENANNLSVIHLAAHAEIDNNNFMYNKLVFSKDSTNNELSASEIYAFPLPSDLVVLSACNTGFGKLEKGEGIMSMSRAFHYAGAKSTVMSLWKVPDKETAIIMYAFYKNLKNGAAKDKALQKAKLEYLQNTKDNLLKHPYYWAGFVVSGNTEPLQNDTHNYWWFILLALIPIVVFRKQLIQRLK